MRDKDVRDLVMEVLTRTIEGLPQGTTQDELRRAIEQALKDHPQVGDMATIEEDDSEAGFRVKIAIKTPPTKPFIDLNFN